MIFALPFHVSHRESLRRLAWMRVIAILSQCLVIAVVQITSDIHLPMIPLVLLIAIQIFWNIKTWKKMKGAITASSYELFIQFLFDIVILSGILYYTGGATNPFVSFYLPAIAVSAAILPWRFSVILSVCSLICYSLMTVYYVPLAIMDHAKAMQYHLTGMWMNFVVSGALITWFVTRMSNALRDRDAQLALAREQYLQNERIIALGSQAASAAHTMGTPLSTISVIAHELRLMTENNPELFEYAEELVTIENQVAQCKIALDKMCQHAQLPYHESLSAMFAEWFTRMLDSWRLRHPDIKLNVSYPKNNEYVKLSHPGEVSTILLTLLDNAASSGFSESETITIQIEIEQRMAIIQIKDQGRGISPQLQEQLGYEPVESTTGGKGIGLMLAFHSAKHIGARISLGSNIPTGTIATLYAPIEHE